jgi:hypothetical protein
LQNTTAAKTASRNAEIDPAARRWRHVGSRTKGWNDLRQGAFFDDLVHDYFPQVIRAAEDLAVFWRILDKLTHEQF